MNGDGRPSFSSLQNSRDAAAAILFYAFDAPVLAALGGLLFFLGRLVNLLAADNHRNRDGYRRTTNELSTHHYFMRP